MSVYGEKKRKSKNSFLYSWKCQKQKWIPYWGGSYKKMCEMISSQDCLDTAMLNDTNDSGNCYF